MVERELENVDGMSILSLNRSRMRAKYWKQLPDGSWHQTGLLPADPVSQAIYFRKGFKAKPPMEAKPESACVCPECGFEAKNKLGLFAHSRKHQ